MYDFPAGAADLESAGAVHGQLRGQRGGEPRQHQGEPLQFLPHGQPHRAVQRHVVGSNPLLQRAAEGLERPGRAVFPHQHQHLAVRAEAQGGRDRVAELVRMAGEDEFGGKDSAFRRKTR